MTDDLAAAIAQFNRKLSCWKDEVARQMDRAERAEALAAKCQAALRTVEWSGGRLDGDAACLIYGLSIVHGHARTCNLAAALAEEESYD